MTKHFFILLTVLAMAAACGGPLALPSTAVRAEEPAASPTNERAKDPFDIDWDAANKEAAADLARATKEACVTLNAAIVLGKMAAVLEKKENELRPDQAAHKRECDQKFPDLK